MKATGQALSFIIWMLLSVTVFAEVETKLIKVGDTLLLPALTDQFDARQSLKSETQWLVFSHDMDSGDLVEEAFKPLDNTKLAAARVQYYADISGMPSLISRFLAIPSLKKLPYSIVLGREDKDLQQMPRQDDKVMLFKLSGSKVIAIKSSDDVKTIRKILQISE